MAGFFAPGIAAGPLIMRFLHGVMRPRHARQTWSACLAARALDRARCIVARPPWSVGRELRLVDRAPGRPSCAWWPPGRGPWCVIRGPVAVPGAPWCLVRGPRSVRPGARPGGRAARPGAPGARSVARAPWWPPAVARAPGGLADGPGSPAAGGRTPAPGPGSKKRAGSRAARAFARFHTVSGAQNSFLAASFT